MSYAFLSSFADPPMREIFFRPEFYDIFGLGVFGFLAVLSLWSLATGRPVPRGVLSSPSASLASPLTGVLSG